MTSGGPLNSRMWRKAKLSNSKNPPLRSRFLLPAHRRSRNLSYLPTRKNRCRRKRAAEPAGFAPQWDSGEETGFAFGKEAEPTPFEIAPEEEFAVLEEKGAPGFETGPAEAEEFFVETVEPAAAEIGEVKAFAPPAEMEFDLQFAPEEEYVPAPEALAPAAPAPAPVRQEMDFQFAPEEEYMPAAEALTAPAPPAAPAAAACRRGCPERGSAGRARCEDFQGHYREDSLGGCSGPGGENHQ